jgi:hypothetical protein
MRARWVLVAMFSVPVLVLAGCGGVPRVTPEPTDSPGPVVPTIGPGTVLTDALTAARCTPNADGSTWAASGTVKNTTKQTRSFDINIFIGPATGAAGAAQVVAVRKLAAGKSAPWTAATVPATSPAGPCYIRVRIAK